MTDFGRGPDERAAARRERERRRALDGTQLESESLDAPVGDPYEEEVPIGIRRVSHRERRGGADRRSAARGDGSNRDNGAATAAPVLEPRGRPPRGARRSSRAAPRRRRRWLARGIALVPVVLVIAAAWFLDQLYQPFQGSPHGQVTVVVPGKAGARQIGNLLAADGVVPSGLFFDLRASLAGDRAKLLSGTYHLRKNMSYGQVLKLLITPPPAAKVTNVTTTPGHTRRGLDLLLAKQGIHGYLAATRHSALLDPRAYGAPASTPTLEGFMFPDTYQLRVPISTGTLVADQLKRFKQVFATISQTAARRRHLTPYEVLIIASLVQAEAQTTHDMPLVASVILNRLHDGIMLQFDSTTRYATGNFTRPLTVSELKSSSPWNTHTHPGLPPTPINNPGLTAIKAAADPPATKFLYFVSKPCSGALAFSSDYGRFLRDVAAFNATQSQNGQPPAKKC